MKLDFTGYRVIRSTKESRKGEVTRIMSATPGEREYVARYNPEGVRFWMVRTRVNPAYNQGHGHWRETVAGKDTTRQLEAFVAAQEVKP